MESRLQKLCCVCGVDLCRQRRTKDPRGRYFCKPCWHSLLAEYYQRNGGPPAMSAVAAADPQPETEQLEESAPPAVLDMPARSAAAADAPAPAILCILPIAVAIPPALCFSPDARLQRVGLMASAAVAAVMAFALVHAAFNRRRECWSIRMIRCAGRWVRDLLHYGSSLSVAIAAAIGLLWLAWSHAGSAGAAILSLGLLIAASQALARRVRPATATRLQTNLPKSADNGSPAPEVAALSDAATGGADATSLPIDADAETRPTKVRPRCRPVFAPGRDAAVRRREAGFRMSDLLTAVACQALENDEMRGNGDSSDSSTLGATLETPLRLAVEARRVGGRAVPADPSSDSSVTGFSAAKMQSWDANRRAWA